MMFYYTARTLRETTTTPNSSQDHPRRLLSEMGRMGIFHGSVLKPQLLLCVDWSIEKWLPSSFYL
jgi:hypothetical protein